MADMAAKYGAPVYLYNIADINVIYRSYTLRILKSVRVQNSLQRASNDANASRGSLVCGMTERRHTTAERLETTVHITVTHHNCLLSYERGRSL